ncbi:MAG: O-antigen ligase family protein [Candidatus Melainabacteria bacterium]|nr:O-antigen ligase family protein [Candidatus Melainabacteria bacterium]
MMVTPLSTAETGQSLMSLGRQSILFGWVFQLVQWADETLLASLKTSWLNTKLQWLFNRHAEPLASSRLMHWLHGVIPCVGLIGLFTLMLVAETGLIGAGIWALFAWLVGSSLLKGYNQWLQKITVVDILVGAFFATFFVSCAFSSYHHEALGGLFKMATFWAGYCAFRTVMVELPSSIPILMTVLIAFGLAETALAYLQSTSKVAELATWTDPSTNPEDQLTRVYGTLKPYNPNLLAAYLLATLGATFWWMGQLLAKLTDPAALKQKLLPWLGVTLVAFGAIAYGIVLTGSRGGYLGVAGMAITCFGVMTPLLLWFDDTLKPITWLKKAWLAVTVGLVLLVGAMILKSSALQHRIASMLAFREDSSISYRMNVYASAWRMFLDNFWTGIGPSNTVFKKVYGFYMTPGYNALGAYSVPLEIALEQGILGLLVLFSFLTYLKIKTYALLTQWNGITLAKKLSTAAAALALVGFFYHGLFDTIWYRPAIQLLFWFFVAVWAYSATSPSASVQPSSVESIPCHDND